MNNEFPYKFDLDVIKQKVDYFVNRGRVSKAIELLEKIEDLWVEKKPNINDSGNDHLMKYHVIGIVHPEGIDDYFLHELGKMISQLKNGSKENHLMKLKNAATNGIVLYYLMEHGSSKEFTWTIDPNKLTGYLETLGIEGKGQQAYNKGIRHLTVDEDNGKYRNYGVFTIAEFKSAMDFLESKDEKAFFAILSDNSAYCLEYLDPDTGNKAKFFRK